MPAPPTLGLALTGESDKGEAPVVAFVRSQMSFVNRLMTGYESMARKSTDMVDMLSARLDSAERSRERQARIHIDMLEAYESLLNDQHARDLKSKESAHRQHLAEDVTSELKALVPLLTKKLARIPLAPSEQGNGMADLLSSLQGEQLTSVMAGEPVVFSMAQRELIVQIAREQSELEQKREAAKGGKTAAKEGDNG